MSIRRKISSQTDQPKNRSWNNDNDDIKLMLVIQEEYQLSRVFSRAWLQHDRGGVIVPADRIFRVTIAPGEYARIQLVQAFPSPHRFLSNFPGNCVRCSAQWSPTLRRGSNSMHPFLWHSRSANAGRWRPCYFYYFLFESLNWDLRIRQVDLCAFAWWESSRGN